MIYEYENRGTAWEPDPEQAAAMERRQRKQFSHVGLAAAAFMLITLAAQMTVMVLVGLLNSLLGDFIDFYGFTGRMLMSSLPMYLVAFPAAAGLLQLVPKCGSPQKEQWGFWKFASFLSLQWESGWQEIFWAGWQGFYSHRDLTPFYWTSLSEIPACGSIC